MNVGHYLRLFNLVSIWRFEAMHIKTLIQEELSWKMIQLKKDSVATSKKKNYFVLAKDTITVAKHVENKYQNEIWI